PCVRAVRHPVVSLSHAPPRRAARQRGVLARQRAAGVSTAELTDDTLGGYWRVHERAPAFGGADGRAYSVGTFVDETPDAQGRYGAALLFVQWSDAGDRPVGHLETEYLGSGATPAAALAPRRRGRPRRAARAADRGQRGSGRRRGGDARPGAQSTHARPVSRDRGGESPAGRDRPEQDRARPRRARAPGRALCAGRLPGPGHFRHPDRRPARAARPAA